MQSIPFTTNFFADDTQPTRTDALAGDATADVLIVGAGVVGLSCAYVLREAGLDVAVVERDHVGFASSGRHMGHITPHMWNYGSKEPHVLAAWAHGCLDWIEELLATEDIDCDFARCPFWLPAATGAEAEVVRRVAAYYAGLGVPARSVEANDFDLVTFRTWGAVVLEDQARAHPYRMVRGLRDAVLRKGVRLYEGTRVNSVEGGPRVTVTTPGGTLRAPKAVLALNAYSGQFPFLRHYTTPMHTYTIVTEPLDEDTARTVGPPPAEDLLIYDMAASRDEEHFYQRLRGDGRLFFGGGGTTPALAPDRMAPDRNDAMFRHIHAEMSRRYPSLGNVRVEAGWGGPICATVRGQPIVADVPEHENIVMAIVGNGNGIGLGTNAGRLVKGLVLGLDTLDESTRAFLEYCGESVDAA